MTIDLKPRKLETEERRVAAEERRQVRQQETEEHRQLQEMEAKRKERQCQHKFEMRHLPVAGDHCLQTPAFRTDIAIKLIPKSSEHDIEFILVI